MGQINLAPTTLYQSNDYKLSVASHELTHVLGLSSALFDYYVDSQGNNLPSNLIYSTRTLSHNGATDSITTIITPTVVQVTADYFNCSNALGADLEDYGGPG